MDFKEALQDYSETPLPLHVVLHMLKGYKRPHDKINQLVQQKILTPVKKGLFIPGLKSNISRPEPFLIANHLRGPSYVSLESALAYWGLIPERVFEISSVTLKSSKEYHTPVGTFTYLHTTLPYYAFGIKAIALTGKQNILIASPEKALCDKIIMTSGILLRSTKQVQSFLLDDLRMDEEQLKQLDVEAIISWSEAALKRESLHMLAKTLNTL